jgi:hypothetical protein
MPASVRPTPNTLPFSTLLTRFVNRLAAGLTALDPSAPVAAESVRVCAAPDANMPEYLGEPGYVLRVRPPVPSTLSGGDRHAYVVDRVIDVFVVSLNLQDVGGRDDAAVKAHLDAEDRVIDVIHSAPPEATEPIGITCKWSPGGEEIVRQMKTNPGLLVSLVPFVVTYRQKFRVLRD